MDILNTTSLESNKQIKINFDGGDLWVSGKSISVTEAGAITGKDTEFIR